MADNIVYLPQDQTYLFAYANPVNQYTKLDKTYEKRVDQHIARLNQQQSILARDKRSLEQEFQALMEARQPVTYNGQRVYRTFLSSNVRDAENSVRLFQGMAPASTFFVFDIETLGDTAEHVKPFGLSEISMNEYDQNGNLVRLGYNQVVRPDVDLIQHLQGRLAELEQDKYAFNKLSNWEKRSIIDLMRFSQIQEKGTANAFIYSQNPGDIKHNAIIDSIFNAKDQTDNAKFIREFDFYKKHLYSGLNTLQNTSIGVTQQEAIQGIIQTIQQNLDKTFISYNGNTFDVPQLRELAKKHGLALPKEFKHLDYLNLIRTVYENNDELKQAMNPDYVSSQLGSEKLASYVKEALGIEDGGFHNAKVDVDNTALVVAKSQAHIQQKIEQKERIYPSGWNKIPNQFSWENRELRHGQELFAIGGVNAYADGDESFKTFFNPETGQWEKRTNSFNQNVISSKGFYQFAGMEDMGDQKLAFRFFNPDQNEYAYIVRQGENAFNELVDFTHSRFFNWENVPEQTKRQILHVADHDRARRRYDSYFSMDGAGKGLDIQNGEIVERGTKGFSGYKRMLENAKIMRDFRNSKGQPYRERVRQLRQQGYSESQAKDIARLVKDEDLLELMNFKSLWDDTTKQYVHNEKEKQHFFKMFNRLIDELPYYEQAIQEIDNRFMTDIQQIAKIPDHQLRTQKLREINHQRDLALMRYHQQVKTQIGEPTQLRSLQPYESALLEYFDPELGRNTTLDLLTPTKAQQAIYGYAKRGINRESETANREMKSRLRILIEQLHSQNKITTLQKKKYHTLLDSSDTGYQVAEKIAVDLRAKSSGHFLTQREEPTLSHNQIAKQISPLQNEAFIQQAIQDTQNAQLMIKLGNVKEEQFQISDTWKQRIDIMDQQRFSSLKSNNLEALEELVTGIQKKYPSLHVAMAMDPKNQGNVRIYAFKQDDSIHVLNQLGRHQKPMNAIEFQLPLINEDGIQVIGNRKLIGHSYAVLDGKEVKTISSAQYITRNYLENLPSIVGAFYGQGSSEGTRKAKNILNETVKNMSGTTPGLSDSDTFKPSYNEADINKQTIVKIENAMIQDLLENGFKVNDTTTLRLTPNDFIDPSALYRQTANGTVLRDDLKFEMIQPKKLLDVRLAMLDWAEQRLGQPVYIDSVKSEMVLKGGVNTESTRGLYTYGIYNNYGRDNAVQYFNAYEIRPEVAKALTSFNGVNRDQTFVTEERLRRDEALGNKTRLNARFAILSQEDFTKRVQEMAQDTTHQPLLRKMGILELLEDGTERINYMALPRLYEQQMIVNEDFAKAFQVFNNKRYEVGPQFTLSKDIQAQIQQGNLQPTLYPGQQIGTMIRSNGVKEKIYYSNDVAGKIIGGLNTKGELDGSGDIRVEWQDEAFKYLIEGEKGTTSTTSGAFLKALTGRDDIVGIFNPNVKKHNDHRMLMSGQVRYLGEELKNLSAEKRAEALSKVDFSQIGVEWDEQNLRFLDRSNNPSLQLKPADFDNVFKQLKDYIAPPKVTIGGIDHEIGSYEMIAAKVEKYNKVVDETGRRVLGYTENEDGILRQYSMDPEHQRDGVKFSHRELGALRQRGMTETHNYIFEEMQQKNQEGMKQVQSLIESIDNTLNQQRYTGQALHFSEFESIPTEYRDDMAYKGTIFHQDTVVSKVKELEAKHGPTSVMNEHGFWVNLPTVNGDAVQVNGQRMEKLFIPFTPLKGTPDGNYLNPLQQHIARIMEKAKAVEGASNVHVARDNLEQLETEVNKYMEKAVYELTSSKGIAGTDAYSTKMATSASGLFKLMDYDTSNYIQSKYGAGEYVAINPVTAKKLGVYDQILEGQRTKKPMYAISLRYPTFHDSALQSVRVIMDESVKEGDFHSTTFGSFLQAADSDGDKGYLTFITNDKVQKELAQDHARTQQYYSDRYEKLMNDFYDETGTRKAVHGATLPTSVEGDSIPRSPITDMEELKAKIGKSGIGSASNLGLAMRQVANEYLADSPDALRAVHRFSQGIEQKGISSKHGASPDALQKLVQNVYAGNWDKVKQIDLNEYGGMFANDWMLNEAADAMTNATQRIQSLRGQSMKFGTSTGVKIGEDMSYQQLLDVLHGKADPSYLGGENTLLSLMYRHQGIEPERFGEAVAEPINIQGNRTKGVQAVRETRHRLQTAASDMLGGGLGNLTESMKQTFQSMKGMSLKKAGLLAGGLAVAGITGYNILNTEKPEMPYNNQQAQQTAPAEPDYSLQQNASIQVSASGGKISQDQLSHAMVQSMNRTGMNAGNTRISINYNDNTQQLNRQWYRDRVQEYV